jgi:hypothetical protein
MRWCEKEGKTAMKLNAMHIKISFIFSFYKVTIIASHDACAALHFPSLFFSFLA